MEQRLQEISIPKQELLYNYYQLFYRGQRGLLNREQESLQMQNCSVTDFSTYLNGFSYGKWKEYTEMQTVRLHLKMQGKFSVTLVGYHLDVYSPIRKEYGTYTYELGNAEEIVLEYPENEEEMLGFEISAQNDTVLFGGYYTGEYAPECLRNVELCLATTTCRKEEFITSNVETLKKEILDADDDMKNHFYIHVVDNGRTLNPDDMKSWHIDVHPNKNTGGSGGFSRGMIESLEQTPKATHVLLMDDDVVVLPESIRRTYRLLTLLKPEYQNHLISGTMLFYEEMNIQHEDVGTLRSNCDYWSLKGRLYQENLKDNLLNEQYYYGTDRRYAGWWYCCIPTPVIEKHGLSMPMFIRGDDIEYSLRCKAEIITMNGICIWHMGFINKYNLSFDRYQRCRNLMVAQACGSIGEEVQVFPMVCKGFRAELLKFNYNGARLILRALQDYLKGPEFLEQDLGEQIVKENAALNEKTVEISNFPGVDWDLPGVWNNPPRKFLDTIWFRITYNGHRFWPSRWLKDEAECILLGDAYQPQRYVRRSKLLAINPDLKIGVMRTIDKQAYKELRREWKKTMKEYKKNGQRVKEAYQKEKDYMTSVAFWKKYLEIDG